ncbi:hypothetical protein [Streptomyces bullii]|uniref:Uncharacterized protein n=1 Tax=Streptomyces bullii TaxID=349910 RepID=A0ABW0V016_9ACTN
MTFSHAWASAPANAVSRHLLGVRITKAGAEEFLIRPRIGDLTQVNGTVPSVRGPVRSPCAAPAPLTRHA